MNWQAPRYDEIKMDAEIGSYQPDTDAPPDRYGHSSLVPPVRQASPETRESAVQA
jgi:hypothetical protein